eukprot:TRINITY_DN2102_c0_g1_i2.p1 TRINITY_DN2102_c0_g1~~TRINITY_DN2102_c0_g1_i2.p1  ORF type:complete len:249 (+),score=26.62 TRINITY_DN2102_c0_g1_i2:99-845(+)
MAMVVNTKEDCGPPMLLEETPSTHHKQFTAGSFPSMPFPPHVGESTRQPCTHNNWDNVRMKDYISNLRCRDCQKIWKVHCAYRDRCADFDAGKCDLGPLCPHTHINRRKEPLEERLARFGDKIGGPRSGPKNPVRAYGARGRNVSGTSSEGPPGGAPSHVPILHGPGTPAPMTAAALSPPVSATAQLMPHPGAAQQGNVLYYVPVVAMVPQQMAMPVNYLQPSAPCLVAASLPAFAATAQSASHVTAM